MKRNLPSPFDSQMADIRAISNKWYQEWEAFCNYCDQTRVS